MLRFLVKYSSLLLITWALVIFILCATPGQYIPSANWLELLSFDKWVHATVFFVLQFLFMVFLFSRKKSLTLVIVALILCVSYGGSLEIMQAKCFSNRSADILDFIANSFGCLVAFSSYSKIKKRVLSVSI